MLPANTRGQLFWLGCHDKGKVFYRQEPLSGESTTTEYGVNYQLLAVITVVAKWRTPSCSRPQSATDNGVRDGRSNWLVAPPPSWAVPPELHVLHGVNAAYKSQDLLHRPGLERASTSMPDQLTTCAATQGINIATQGRTWCQHCSIHRHQQEKKH